MLRLLKLIASMTIPILRRAETHRPALLLLLLILLLLLLLFREDGTSNLRGVAKSLLFRADVIICAGKLITKYPAERSGSPNRPDFYVDVATLV